MSLIEDKVREEKELCTQLEASSATRLPRGKLSPRSTAVNMTESSQSTESLPLQGTRYEQWKSYLYLQNCKYVLPFDFICISLLPVTDGIMEVFVSAMESPSQFWVQIVGPGTTALDKLVLEMTTYYNDEENLELHTLKNVSLCKNVLQIGLLCANVVLTKNK